VVLIRLDPIIIVPACFLQIVCHAGSGMRFWKHSNPRAGASAVGAPFVRWIGTPFTTDERKRTPATTS
jgi:hypothetical protein